MGPTRHNGQVWAGLTLILIVESWAPSTSGADADLPEHAALRDELKLLWDGLETLAFRCEEIPLDDDGELDRTRGYNVFDIAIASGARRTLTATAFFPEGKDLIRRMCEDGRRHYRIVAFPGHPQSIRRLVIMNQEGSHEEYRGLMPVPLWFWMPGGRPLHIHLDRGARLERVAAEHGQNALVVEIEHRGTVRCTLDPTRDWLPRLIEFGKSQSFRVNRFGRDNGRWFPLEIETLRTNPPEGVARRGLALVNHLRINRLVPDSTFHPPSLTDGVVVEDRTRKTTYVRGGLDALKRLEAPYRKQHSPENRAAAPIVASRTSGRLLWSPILVVVSGLLFALAVIFHWWRGREHDSANSSG